MELALALVALLGGQSDPAEEKRLDKFRKILEKTPDDPEACLQIGRYLCLIKGDFPAGLPLLSKGKDVAIRQLAEYDLGTKKLDEKGAPLTGATMTFGDDVAPDVVKGDEWWTQASREKGVLEKRNAFNRSVYWYRQALLKIKDPPVRKKLYSRIDAYLKILGPVTVTVPANKMWVDAGIDLVSGEKISFAVTGRWCLDNNPDKSVWCDMKGYAQFRSGVVPMGDEPVCALVARIDQEPPFAVYKSPSFVSEKGGRLFFAPNAHPPENTVGSMTVVLTFSIPQ